MLSGLFQTANSEVLPPLQAGFVLAAILAAIYGIVLVRRPQSNLKTAVKTLSIGSLTVLSWQLGGPIGLTLALGFSALGDYFLAHDGKQYFLPGLAAFLAAHLAYSALFWTSGVGLSETVAHPFTFAIAVMFIVIAAGALVQLYPHLGALKLPVIIYIAAIMMMGLTALTVRDHPLVAVGAILFMISDFVLAQERFVLSHNSNWRIFTSPLLWSFYWLGQALIAASLLLAIAK